MNEYFLKKCRLCGRYGRRFTDIFSSNISSEDAKPNKKLSQLIYKCLQLQVKEDDCLPKKICDDCNKKLICWQSFHRKCEQTQKKLLQYVQDFKKKTLLQAEKVDSSKASVKKIQASSENVIVDAEKEIVEDEPKQKQSINKENNVYKKATLESRNNNHKKVVCDTKRHKKAVLKLSKPVLKNHKKISNVSKTEEKEKAVDESVVSKETDNKSSESTTKECHEKEQELHSKAKEKDHSFQCNICDMTFTHRGRYNVHLAGHHNIATEFQCEKCNKNFCSKFSLRSHLETHSESRNYCCHLCGRLFHTASGLCNHVKLHSEDNKRFPCPLCGKQFRQAGHLDQHQRTHTGERPHQCPECAQRFTTRCQLSRHVQGVHRGTKKHKCHMCGKEFLYNNNYKAHMLRHAGQRNNKCGECGKTFVTSNGLFRHRRSHTGDKPFQCNICGKKFADCSNRKRHLLRHLQQPKEVKGKRCGARPKIARVICLVPLQEQNNGATYTVQLNGSLAAQAETNSSNLVATCNTDADVTDLTLPKKPEISVSAPEAQLDHSKATARKAEAEKGQLKKSTESDIEKKSTENADEPKTYENLRTFLESSEVIETLAGDKGEEGLVNIEYVTLLAATGEANSSEVIQQVIVLPQESQLANYEMNAPVTAISVKDKKNTESKPQESPEVCILPDDMLVSQSKPNKSASGCENLIEVLLAEEKLDNTSTKESTTQQEAMDSSNLIQVLLASDDNASGPDNSSKAGQSFLVPPDSFADEDAIIRMLNSQGTVMLSTQSDPTEFDLTENTELTAETVQRNATNREVELSSDSNFKAFPSVRDAAMCEDIDKKSNIYEPEVTLTTATDEILVQSTTEPMDDIEMFELCAEDELNKLGPMYQVYHADDSLAYLLNSQWSNMIMQLHQSWSSDRASYRKPTWIQKDTVFPTIQAVQV